MVYTYRTVTDLKNRARKIGRAEPLPRHQALDEAARRGGYENYAHALKHLPASIMLTGHVVEIRQRWRNRKTRTQGIATVSVLLRTRLPDLLRPHQLVEALGSCTLESDTLLRSDGFMRDREDSVDDLAKLARALQFIDATGLKPSRARKCYPKGNWDNRPPIADHDSCWFDPETRVHVLVTQPYPGRASSHRNEQSAWEQRHGWQTLQTGWGSLYGHGTEFVLLCPEAYAPVLSQKIARLEQLGPALTNEAVDCGGQATERIAA